MQSQGCSLPTQTFMCIPPYTQAQKGCYPIKRTLTSVWDWLERGADNLYCIRAQLFSLAQPEIQHLSLCLTFIVLPLSAFFSCSHGWSFFHAFMAGLFFLSFSTHSLLFSEVSCYRSKYCVESKTFVKEAIQFVWKELYLFTVFIFHIFLRSRQCTWSLLPFYPHNYIPLKKVSLRDNDWFKVTH